VAIKRNPNSSVLIYEKDTLPGRDVYVTVSNERIKRLSLSTWERRVVNGSPSADAEEFISSWTQDDYSGGIGIEDANEGTDGSRVRFAFMDLRSPKHATHAPKTLRPTKPSWASGTSMPLGDVVSSPTADDARFYMAWGTHAGGWIESSLSYSNTDNSLLGRTPVKEGTQFGGWLFVPCTDGFVALRQSSDATQTLNVQSSAVFIPRCFGTWNNNLWALDVNNRLWQIDPVGVETSPITAVADVTWTQVKSPLLEELVLDRSHTPKELLTYYNRDGAEVMWCVTNKGAWMLDFATPQWIQTTLKASMHPDFGNGAVVWRTGEDLWIGAGGLDVTRFTAGSIDVPLSGPGRDQGVPAEYYGTVVDLEAERSTLYALIKGLPPTDAPTLDDMESVGQEVSYLSTPGVAMWLAAWTGTAWCCLSRETDTTGEPTRLCLSTAKSSYRLHWGGTDGQARSQLIPPAFYNPRARIQRGQDPFELVAELETFRYDANMSGWDKIASHAFAMTDFATTTQYIDVYYRTDADLPTESSADASYTLWKRINNSGRTLLWFDDTEEDPRTGLPWREGLNFQWIQFFFRSVTTNELLAPIFYSFSLHHIRVPQDAASYVIKIPFFEGPGGRGAGHRSGQEMATTLREMQRLRKMIHFQPNNYESFRGRIVGISEEAWPGGENFSSVMVVNFVEIGASINTHQVVA
jgi:hypothetical protein